MKLTIVPLNNFAVEQATKLSGNVGLSLAINFLSKVLVRKVVIFSYLIGALSFRSSVTWGVFASWQQLDIPLDIVILLSALLFCI